MSRKILSALAVLGISIVLVAGCGRSTGTKATSKPAAQRQPAEPGIRIGESLLSRRTLPLAGLGSITDLVFADLDPREGMEFGIAGESGAEIRPDVDGQVLSSISFDERLSHVDIVDVESDGKCEYLNRGDWGSAPALYDHQGKRVWTHKNANAADDTAFGDINGDGKLEFAIGFNGGGGISLLSSKGATLWNESDANVWHVEMVDTNSDGGKLEIVHSNARGEMTVRDGKGQVVTSASVKECYFSHFSICRWPARSGREHALQASDEELLILDFRGRRIATLPAQGANALGHARSCYVKFRGDEPDYFAAVVDSRREGSSALFVYDSKGNLVYHELVPDRCTCIAAKPAKGTGSETLLLGASYGMLEYRMKQPAEHGRDTTSNSQAE